MNVRYQKRKELGLCTRCGVCLMCDGVLCKLCKKYMRKYRINQWNTKKGKEKRQNNLRKWQKRNKEYCRKRQNRYNLEIRLEVIAHYGGMCQCCGEKQIEFLCIDHINNDGAKHRKETGYSSIYRWLKQNNYPKQFQILCWNCNLAKEIYGKCPHKSKN